MRMGKQHPPIATTQQPPIATADQHLMRMGTMQSTSHGVRGGGGGLELQRDLVPKNDVEVAGRTSGDGDGSGSPNPSWKPYRPAVRGASLPVTSRAPGRSLEEAAVCRAARASELTSVICKRRSRPRRRKKERHEPRGRGKPPRSLPIRTKPAYSYQACSYAPV